MIAYDDITPQAAVTRPYVRSIYDHQTCALPYHGLSPIPDSLITYPFYNKLEASYLLCNLEMRERRTARRPEKVCLQSS